MGAIATCPLEVVKTRLQASQHKDSLQTKFRFGLGTANALHVLMKEEGFPGLWRGLGPHLAGVVPARAIHFFVYGNLKNFFKQNGYGESAWVHFVSALAAGGTVVTLTSPMWVIKTRVQLQNIRQSQGKYTNAFDATHQIYHKEGILAFWKGLSASYLGLSETVLQFVIYEKLKSSIVKKEEKKLTVTEFLTTASIAKLIASAATYPHEVIRTRLREQRNERVYTGVFSGLAKIYKEEGVRGLYGGMGAHLIRVVPNAAIMFLTYELVLLYFS
eukprot:TRINITY_DN5167_c0_g1_i2.p1 TRINITY_DN5167_c0_g1~~TRINITY_DN5167_c0_g1_i2.p1  ORF type:complete len:273 (-),score=30.87 TRINITY_DN5167_c0_g1_i2:22-840(-)